MSSKCLICYAILLVHCATCNNFLIYPNKGKIGLVLGFGVPVNVERGSLIFGYAIKCNYNTPTNLTQLHYTKYNKRKKRSSLSRWQIYSMLAQESEMRRLGGKSCVLRSICEASETPVDKYHGFFNELFYTIFTPTTTNEILSQHSDNEYFAAQKLGIQYPGKCQHFFPDCKQTFFDLFTKIYPPN